MREDGTFGAPVEGTDGVYVRCDDVRLVEFVRPRPVTIHPVRGDTETSRTGDVMTQSAKKRRRGWLPPRSGGYHGYDGPRDESGRLTESPPSPPSGSSGVSGFTQRRGPAPRNA